MKVCRVVGSVTATIKHPAYVGHKLMVCQPLDERGAPKGDEVLAVDRVQAGVGDTVLVMSEGSGVRQLIGTLDGKMPVRSLILGIVDAVDVDPDLHGGA